MSLLGNLLFFKIHVTGFMAGTTHQRYLRTPVVGEGPGAL